MTSGSSFIVLGAGAWGSALALHLSRQHHSVVLWGHDPLHTADFARTRRHENLPGVEFPPSMVITSSLEKAFAEHASPIVLLVVPSFAFYETTKKIAPFLKPSTPVIWGTKGLSSQGELLHVVCEQNTGARTMGVLSGPSFAMEVAKELPTAVTLALSTTESNESLQKAFHSECFRVYLSHDIIGVELGGVVKNIIAIAVGMSDGLGYGANARSALVTRGLAELSRIGQVLGAKVTTFMGLSGVGDMVLTCTDNQSRNRRFGLALGEGKSQADAIQQVGKVVEGQINVKQVLTLAKHHNVEMPLCSQVYAVLYEGITPQQAVTELLMREPKAEDPM